jgi:hypothetical protein
MTANPESSDFPMTSPFSLFLLALLLAQGGATKMLAGWGLVLLGLVLGILVVCRPSVRKGDWKK